MYIQPFRVLAQPCHRLHEPRWRDCLARVHDAQLNNIAQLLALSLRRALPATPRYSLTVLAGNVFVARFAFR